MTGVGEQIGLENVATLQRHPPGLQMPPGIGIGRRTDRHGEKSHEEYHHRQAASIQPQQ